MKQSYTNSQLKNVLIIAGGHFAHDIYSSFLAPFLPLIIDKFDLTMTIAGLLTFFFRLPSFFSPLFGILSDRIDMRHLAIIAPALTAVMMSLLGAVPYYSLVVILLFIAGISASLFHVLGPVMIARVSSSNLGRGMGFWMVGGEFSRTVGPLLAVWAVSLWTFEGSYPVMIVGIAASAFLYIYMKDIDLSHGKYYTGDLKKTWLSIARVMLPLSGIMISVSLMNAALVIFLPTYMVSSGKSLWFGGTCLAVLELSGTLGIYTGGTFSDRIGRHTVLLAAIPMASLLMICFVHAPGWLIFPLLILLGFVAFAVTPVELALVQDHAKYHRGTANGLYMGISFFISAGATVAFGGLADVIGIKNAYIVSAILGFTGIPLILLLPRRENNVGKT